MSGYYVYAFTIFVGNNETGTYIAFNVREGNDIGNKNKNKIIEL